VVRARMQGTAMTVRWGARTFRIVRLAQPANEPLVRLGPARAQQQRHGQRQLTAHARGAGGGGESGLRGDTIRVLEPEVRTVRAPECCSNMAEAVAMEVEAAPAVDERVAWANKMRLLVRTYDVAPGRLARSPRDLPQG